MVINQDLFGGPHNQALRLAEPLRERHWTLRVVVPAEGSGAHRLREGGVQTLIVPYGRPRARVFSPASLAWALGLTREIRTFTELYARSQPDVVIACGLTNLQPALGAGSEGVPLVWQLLGTVAPPYARRLLSPLVSRSADVVMTAGRAVAPAHPGIEEMGERWIPFVPPVDIAQFRPVEGGSSKDHNIVIGTVGNRNMLKGHEVLVEAFARLQRSIPATRLRIVGEPSVSHAQRYEEVVVAAAARLNPGANRCSFETCGSGVADRLREFDVFVLPSHSEGLPTALLEAMAVGLPVVATRVGAVPEVIRDGSNGLLVDPGRPEQLADALEQLALVPELRGRLGRSAREWVVRHASADACADAHVRAFETAMQRTGRIMRLR